MRGALFSAVVVIHLVRVSMLVLRGRASLSLVPTRQDFRDAIITLRYYLGMSTEQARFIVERQGLHRSLHQGTVQRVASVAHPVVRLW